MLLTNFSGLVFPDFILDITLLLTIFENLSVIRFFLRVDVFALCFFALRCSMAPCFAAWNKKVQDFPEVCAVVGCSLLLKSPKRYARFCKSPCSQLR